MLEYSAHLLSKVVPESERAYQTALSKAYALAVEKLSKTSSTVTKQQLTAIIKSITDELYAINKDFQKALPYDIETITEYDNQYLTEELQLTIKTNATIYALPKETIKELVDLKTLQFYSMNKDGVRIEGKKYTMEAMLDGISKSTAQKVKGVIMAEFASGSTPQAIARKLSPFITTMTKKHIRTVVRTLLAEATSKAQSKFYDENKSFIDGYIFSAVLDSRTSQLCASLDGRRFKTRASWYEPPIHPNCRSKLIAVPDGYKVGQRPIVLKDGTVIVLKDKDITYKKALELYPQLSNKKLINVEQYIKGLGIS